MIKLKSLIENSVKLKCNIPSNPFDGVHNYEDDLFVDDEDWKDDDDTNMSDEEWDEFQSYLDDFLNDIKNKDRINELTKQIIDVDDLVIEFMLMDEDTRKKLNSMDDETNKIRNILHQKRKNGNTCMFWKKYGIKHYGDKGLFDKLYNWEKRYYMKHHSKSPINETKPPHFH